MTDTAIAYIRQQIFTDPGTALQSLNLEIYYLENYRKYYGVQIVKTYIEPSIVDSTPILERKEVVSALEYLNQNPSTALLVSSLSHFSNQTEKRHEILDLFLKRGFRLLCGSPLLDHTTQGGKFFGNGDRTPSTEELLQIWDTAQEVELFEELQNWIDRDRAAQAAQPTTERKWFGGDHPVPSIDDMLNQKNFDEMLRELE